MGKTLKTILGMGTGLAMSLMTGCEAPKSTQMAVGSYGFNQLASAPYMTPSQQTSALATGGLLNVVAQQEAMKEAAREGKTTVNVYVNGNQVNSSNPSSEDDINSEENKAKRRVWLMENAKKNDINSEENKAAVRAKRLYDQYHQKQTNPEKIKQLEKEFDYERDSFKREELTKKYLSQLN
jgi:hypothetical protein